MLKRAFSVFSRGSAAAKPVVQPKLSASEIIQRAHEKVKDPKCDAKKPIVWIDCEMTGLDHKNDYIIEICCLITDKDLKLIDHKGYESVIHQDKKVMDRMDEWCVLHHGQSGLTEKVIKSKKTMEQVETELLTYLQKYMNKGVGILAGNSVHMDRLFMLKDMPRVVDYLTYRIIDMSSVMEICKRFHPLVAHSRPKKKGAHTAREDILESIQDLDYYRGVYFKDTNEATKETIDGFLASWSTDKSEDAESTDVETAVAKAAPAAESKDTESDVPKKKRKVE